MTDEKLVPQCRKRTMVKKKLPNGRFAWICKVYGLQRGEFKVDKKKGVV